MGSDPEHLFTHFEFGRRPGHFVQRKAWRQPSEGVKLADSGGHDAVFRARKPFPYKFLLKHYPLRNPEQAYRKIFLERLPRYNPETMRQGWHVQYNHCTGSDSFMSNHQELTPFSETTGEEYLVELISGIGIVR